MILEGKPLKGKGLELLKNYLIKNGKRYDEKIEYSVCILNDSYEIIATGSVTENIIKCIVVEPGKDSQQFFMTIISKLIQYEFGRGRKHIMIYAEPQRRAILEELGFYLIHQTDKIVFMENQMRREKADGF